MDSNLRRALPETIQQDASILTSFRKNTNYSVLPISKRKKNSEGRTTANFACNTNLTVV